ncbi:tRNA lysidine(34) synthetase TilS [Clostridiaceae bacterium M8S5]|nr:tRNA lysidine(34) synthetase TilS [Clostridiaceae bacterium M8S5]
MEKIVYKTIMDEKLILPGDKLVIGVSGGPDSMALLCVLKSIQKLIEFSMVAVHINHGVRGKEANMDERYVKDITQKWSIPYYSKRVNMNEYARLRKLSSEEAGRELRYQFFNEVLKIEKADKIAVAHNRNDQAETLIMRFLRGTGIEGLKGMQYEVNNVIRPLLDVDRSIIEKYCNQNKLFARIDKTNLEPIYGRNKIRLELIPYIENNINKGIINTMNRTSKIMGIDDDFINNIARYEYSKICITNHDQTIEFDICKFKGLHTAIKSRVIRIGIKEMYGDNKNIELKHVENMIEFIENATAGRIHESAKGIELVKKYKTCLMRKKVAKKKSAYKNKLEINSNNYNNNFKTNIVIEVKDIQNFDIKYKHRFIKYIDYDKIKGDLYIRNRKSGDKFIPFGMKGSKKLKDYFIDNKIPREKRDNIPIIEDDENIIWVVGYRLSDLYKVDEGTKRILSMQYITKEDLHD